jgi:hypothetical protein
MIFAGLSTACAADEQEPASGQFTNSKFLELDEGQQQWYFIGAFDAIGHAVHLQNEEQGRCVWQWLFDDYDVRKAAIVESMQRFPDHSPTSIIIAHLDKACGKLPRA